MQMVSLYRDPKGENIFKGSEESESKSYCIESITTTLSTTIIDETRVVRDNEVSNETEM